MPLQQNSAIASGYKRPPLWARVLLLLCSVLFLIGLLFGVLRGSITNRAFFEAEYARIGQAAYMGMNEGKKLVRAPVLVKIKNYKELNKARAGDTKDADAEHAKQD